MNCASCTTKKKKNTTSFPVRFHLLPFEACDPKTRGFTNASELTAEEEALVTKCFYQHPPDEVLSDAFSIKITRKDMQTLKGLNWLNDEVGVQLVQNQLRSCKHVLFQDHQLLHEHDL
jgi:hypothetical protein